jgi:hypothetical protein
MRTINKIVLDLVLDNHITPEEAEMLLNSQNNLQTTSFKHFPSKLDLTNDQNKEETIWWKTITCNINNNENS